MQKDLFSTRLISLLAVQDGLVPASTIGLSITQNPPSIKTQLKPERFAVRKQKGVSHAK